ncbi:hypothetical protein FGB62_217g00 [Gracilaria domingensis]|nr:hypothetical protein FGB62_217g00 [Gracilaria domingensis]
MFAMQRGGLESTVPDHIDLNLCQSLAHMFTYQECLKHHGLLEPVLRPRKRLGKRKVYVVNNPKYEGEVNGVRKFRCKRVGCKPLSEHRDTECETYHGVVLFRMQQTPCSKLRGGWAIQVGRIVTKTIVYVVEYKGGERHREAISSGAIVNITRSHTNRKSNQLDQEGENARDEPNIQPAFLDGASVCKRGVLIQVFSLSSEPDQRLRLAELLSRQLGGRQLLTAWLAHGDGATRAERGAAAGGTKRDVDGSEQGCLLRSHV